jgi:hypothetical protein
MREIILICYLQLISFIGSFSFIFVEFLLIIADSLFILIVEY